MENDELSLNLDNTVESRNLMLARMENNNDTEKEIRNVTRKLDALSDSYKKLESTVNEMNQKLDILINSINNNNNN